MITSYMVMFGMDSVNINIIMAKLKIADTSHYLDNVFTVDYSEVYENVRVSLHSLKAMDRGPAK